MRIPLLSLSLPLASCCPRLRFFSPPSLPPLPSSHPPHLLSFLLPPQAPLQTLLFSTTETLQTAALDRVLLSFPSILGDEPVAELRVLVEGRKENVLKKVKEGVEMLLRRE